MTALLLFIIGALLGAGLGSGRQSLLLAAAFIAFAWWIVAGLRKERNGNAH